ncbi:ankyrin repeat domain-containing protein [Flavobacterium selenitireducens]|uniref:ankyrin repeat domain-containing protein n=1 Tax=Flavobacterium selenitireducens TaxID=2722704 RepID=UPI00168AAFB5|nr:ankyrin repeat domain-containing protein [Flavobacterium selenitireducens]MBD3582346.1 ankyrin repeat domain-containing protein [Flavobacterium selenitireducens]
MKKCILLVAFICVGGFVRAQSESVFDVARTGSVEDARKMVASDPKLVNAVNAEGYSPLILACYRSNNEVAKYLLEKGADIDALSGMGTALMAAVVKGNQEMVRYLLEKKANPNLADQNGTTALLYAVMFKKHEIASLLVNAGANTGHKDNHGQSAIDYAVVANDDKFIEILKSKKL